MGERRRDCFLKGEGVVCDDGKSKGSLISWGRLRVRKTVGPRVHSLLQGTPTEYPTITDSAIAPDIDVDELAGCVCKGHQHDRDAMLVVVEPASGVHWRSNIDVLAIKRTKAVLGNSISPGIHLPLRSTLPLCWDTETKLNTEVIFVDM